MQTAERHSWGRKRSISGPLPHLGPLESRGSGFSVDTGGHRTLGPPESRRDAPECMLDAPEGSGAPHTRGQWAAQRLPGGKTHQERQGRGSDQHSHGFGSIPTATRAMLRDQPVSHQGEAVLLALRAVPRCATCTYQATLSKSSKLRSASVCISAPQSPYASSIVPGHTSQTLPKEALLLNKTCAWLLSTPTTHD
jgi:hypothetical protein